MNTLFFYFYYLVFGSDTWFVAQGQPKEREGTKYSYTLEHNTSQWYMHLALKRNKH